MEVRHTKFRPYETFGSIRQHVDVRGDILRMKEMVTATPKSSKYSRCVLFPVEQIQNWKNVSATFNFLPGLRKWLAYKIQVQAVSINGSRNVLVCLSRAERLCSGSISESFEIRKIVPALNIFENVLPEGLLKDEYSVLKRNRIKMSEEAQS